MTLKLHTTSITVEEIFPPSNPADPTRIAMILLLLCLQDNWRLQVKSWTFRLWSKHIAQSSQVHALTNSWAYKLQPRKSTKTILALSGGPQILVWKSCNWTSSRCDVIWQNEPLDNSQWMTVYIPPSKSYHNSPEGLMCIFQKTARYLHWEQRCMKPKLLHTDEIKSTWENGIKKISNQLTTCPHLPMTRI